MTEPLTGKDLQRISREADRFSHQACHGCRVTSKRMVELLAEVERLKAEAVQREQAQDEAADNAMSGITAALVLEEQIGDLV